MDHKPPLHHYSQTLNHRVQLGNYLLLRASNTANCTIQLNVIKATYCLDSLEPTLPAIIIIVMYLLVIGIYYFFNSFVIVIYFRTVNSWFRLFVAANSARMHHKPKWWIIRRRYYSNPSPSISISSYQLFSYVK